MRAKQTWRVIRWLLYFVAGMTLGTAGILIALGIARAIRSGVCGV